MPNHRCRQMGCPNTYSDVVGGDMAFGKHYAGADCLPCFYAAMLHDNGQTPEQIEAHPTLMNEFIPHLDKCGWSWRDVKDSFNRVPAPMVI